MQQRCLRQIAWLALVLTAGCSASPWLNRGGPRDGTVQTAAFAQATSDSSATTTTKPDAPDIQAVRQLLLDIQEVQALDAETQEQLVEDLQNSPPELWQKIAQNFRATLAMRKQLERERATRSEGASEGTAANGGEQAPSPSSEESGTSPAVAVNPSPTVPAGSPTDADRLDAELATSQAAMQLSRVLMNASNPRAQDRSSLASPHQMLLAASELARSTSTSGGSDDDASGSRGEDWRVSLDKTIEQLSAATASEPTSPAEVADQVRLRMLCLAAGRRREALEPITSLQPAMQEFWTDQFFGLATLTEPGLISDPTQRAAEALGHLEHSTQRLSEVSPLLVRNTSFVTKVDSYGVFEPCEKYDFRPGQEIALYAEIKNFISRETPRGHFTSFRSSYQIFDSRGTRVADHEFKVDEEYCRNPRRDFFIGYGLRLPDKIPAGRYVLQLTVSDLNRQKMAQTQLEFNISSSDES